jgi:hypothetical protein
MIKMKTKLIPVKYMQTDLACYENTENKIYYNKELNKYPKLKKFCLTHENKHSLKPKDYLYHLKIDLLDYPKVHLNHNLAKQYYDMRFNSNEEKGLGPLIYYFGNFIIRLILFPLRVYSEIVYYIYELKNWLFKK